MMDHPSPVMERLKDNSMSIRIARVPKETKKRFQEIADAEFCGDYGFLLKFLLDGLLDKDMKEVFDRLSAYDILFEDMEARLTTLEGGDKKNKKNLTIHKLDGSKIEYEKKEKEE